MCASWQSATHVELVSNEKCGIILNGNVIMLACNLILNFEVRFILNAKGVNAYFMAICNSC